MAKYPYPLLPGQSCPEQQFVQIPLCDYEQEKKRLKKLEMRYAELVVNFNTLSAMFREQSENVLKRDAAIKRLRAWAWKNYDEFLEAFQQLDKLKISKYWEEKCGK